MGLPRTARQGEPGRDEALDRNNCIVESGPDVTLYANKSEESQQAFEALEQSGIRFRVVPSPRRKRPVAAFGPDEARGLSDIQNLIEALEAASTALIEASKKWQPDLLNSADPEVKRRYEQLKQEELEQARAVMAQLQTASRGRS